MTEPTYRFPEAEVETSIGTVRVWSTGADHVGVSSPDKYENGTKAPSITIRNIPYSFRMDLHPAAYHVAQTGEPSWQAKDEDAYRYPFDSVRLRGGSYYHGALYMNRTDKFMGGASEAAKWKAFEVIIPAVNEFLRTSEGLAMLEAATKEHALQDRARAQAKYDEARAALEAAEAELAAATEEG